MGVLDVAPGPSTLPTADEVKMTLPCEDGCGRSRYVCSPAKLSSLSRLNMNPRGRARTKVQTVLFKCMFIFQCESHVHVFMLVLQKKKTKMGGTCSDRV